MGMNPYDLYGMQTDQVPERQLQMVQTPVLGSQKRGLKKTARFWPGEQGKWCDVLSGSW